MNVTRRAFLATLSKVEHLDIGRRCELEVRATMTKDDLLDQIAPAKRAELATILPALAYESLKASCKELGLPGYGREKSVFVARLLTAMTPAGHATRARSPSRRSAAASARCTRRSSTTRAMRR